MNETDFTNVIHYVNSPLHANKPNIRNLSLEDAVKLSDEWHESIASKENEIEDESGTILMTFDDGFYWINLETTTDKDEAKAMGHCGNTNNGTTILSLRKDKQPHVTIAWNEDDNIFTQIKGKGNTKPVERYHPYIVDLIIELDVQGFKSEYNRTTDFDVDDLNDDLKQKLEDENPTYIENSKPPSREELEEKYREYLNSNWEYEVFEIGVVNIFYYVDDDAFLENLLDDEIENGRDEFKDYFDEEQLYDYVESNVDEDDLSNIKWKSKKDPTTKQKYVNVFDFIKNTYKVSDYEELFDELKIMDDFLKGYFDTYNSAEDYIENIFGKIVYPIEQWVRQALSPYIDEDEIIDDLVNEADDEYLEAYM
jgi:hypothetical protein